MDKKTAIENKLSASNSPKFGESELDYYFFHVIILHFCNIIIDSMCNNVKLKFFNIIYEIYEKNLKLKIEL